MNYEELEILRKKLKVKYVIMYCLISIILLFIVLSIISIFTSLNFGLNLTFIIILLLPLLYFSNVIPKLNNEYKRKFKNMYVGKAVERLNALKEFKQLDYNVYGMGSQKIRAINMISGNEYETSDSVEGQYKNINFLYSDVVIKRRIKIYMPDNKNDYDDNDIEIRFRRFKGSWVILDYNNENSLNTDIKIYPKFSRKTMKTVFKYEKVKLENKEFNKYFNVYSKDGIDYLSILNPVMMENIIKLKNTLKSKIFLCFNDNKLHIGVYNKKDLFEYTNIFKEYNEEEVIEKICNDIKNITLFIDTLF